MAKLNFHFTFIFIINIKNSCADYSIFLESVFYVISFTKCRLTTTVHVFEFDHLNSIHSTYCKGTRV